MNEYLAALLDAENILADVKASLDLLNPPDVPHSIFSFPYDASQASRADLSSVPKHLEEMISETFSSTKFEVSATISSVHPKSDVALISNHLLRTSAPEEVCNCIFMAEKPVEYELPKKVPEYLDRCMRLMGVPDEKKESTQAALLGLLTRSASVGGGWTGKIGRERSGVLDRISLPSEPPRDRDDTPITWKTHKGDLTPPEFLLKHYGAYLRNEGTGLNKSDINKLDDKLYRAIANFLTKNPDSWPEECPLPTLGEAKDLRLRAAFPGMEMRDIEAELQRLRTSGRA